MVSSRTASSSPKQDSGDAEKGGTSPHLLSAHPSPNATVTDQRAVSKRSRIDTRPSNTRHGTSEVTGLSAQTTGTSSARAHTGDSTRKGHRHRHHKRVGRLPFLRAPVSEDGGPWLEEEHEASEWVSLFYDLAVVAVLTVFSTTHELATPSSIPIFFSYFVIISWIWTSQVHYDIRYQAEDVFHRICKSLQITVFVYIGASSGNWSLSMLRDPDSIPDLTGKEKVGYSAAGDSFYTVVIAFIASRALLIFQYAVAAGLGKAAGRDMHSQLFSIGSLGFSIIFSIIAVALPSTSKGLAIAKIVLFYMSIVSELVGMRIQWKFNLHHRIRTEAVGERYGAFTLIILGEGFISMTRAFNRAIAGLSESNTATYLQVFLAITIMYLLYLFLFGRFRKEDEVGQKRALLWQAIHFPLHFALLLLLGAMVNTIIVISYAHGINSVTHEFSLSLDYIKNGTQIGSEQRAIIEGYLDRLTLEPSYDVEYAYLEELTQMENPPDDPTLLGYQYFGQIILQTTISYGLEVNEDVLNTFEQLYSVNTTWTTNDTLRDLRRENASELLIDVIQDPVDEALSGILWLFPCAGGVLVLIALRSMIWYRYEGIAHWIIHLPMFVAGLALALLGLLDVGSRQIDVLRSDELEGTNPMYQLLSTKMPLVIVMLVYLGIHLGTLYVMGFLHRRRGDIL